MGRRRECRNGASQPETEQTRTDAMPPKTEDVARATAEARALFALRKASGEEVAVLHTKGDASPMAAGTSSKETNTKAEATAMAAGTAAKELAKEGAAALQTSTSTIINDEAIACAVRPTDAGNTTDNEKGRRSNRRCRINLIRLSPNQEMPAANSW